MTTYHVELSYNHGRSGFLSSDATLEQALATGMWHLTYYRDELGYAIDYAVIAPRCSLCNGLGKVRKCRHKRHAFVMEKCYKPCPVCHGIAPAPCYVLDIPCTAAQPQEPTHA